MEEKKPQTLEDIIAGSDKEGVREKLTALVASMKDQAQKDSLGVVLQQIVESNNKLADAITGMADALDAIKNRPDPKFPEPKDFPAVQKVSMDRPDWQKDPEKLDMSGAVKPHFDALKTHLTNEGEKTRGVLLALLNKEPEKAEVKTELQPKTVNSAAVRSRRTTQWKIATYPQAAGTSPIISKGDNLTYYLPDQPIKNSQTISLNGQNPASYGTDYTMVGNAIVFVQNQSGSNIEVRYQVK